MGSCSQVVLGSNCADQINYGETIDVLFTYTNENGTPIDLSSSTAEVFSSSPAIIKDAGQISISDAPNGVVRFILHRDDAISLRRGISNRFRVRVIFGPDSDDVTPDIYLQVT